MSRRPRYLALSDLTDAIGTAAFDSLHKHAIVTADGEHGRITVTIASQRRVYQRFHIFIVEEPA